MNTEKNNNGRSEMYIMIAYIIGVFIVDYFVPLGYSIWAGYLPAIIASALIGHEKLAPRVIILTALLTILGIILSPEGQFYQGIANRLLGLLLIGLCGMLSLKYIKKLSEIEKSEREIHQLNRQLQLQAEEKIKQFENTNRRLDKLVEERTEELFLLSQKNKKINNLFYNTQQIAKIGAWEFDLNTREIFWTDEVYRICEIEKDVKIDYQKFIDSYQPAYQKIINDAVTNAIEKRESYDLELKLTTAKKQEIWVRTIGKPVVKDGKVVALQGLIQDIDKKKKREEALRVSEERFDLAVNASNDGIWDVADLNKEEEWWSPRVYELLGYKNKEIAVNRDTTMELIHPADIENTTKIVRSHFEDNMPLDLEYRLKTKSGEYKWFKTKAKAVRDENGQPVRLVGCLTDITQSKLNEEKIHTLNSKLEQKVKERTTQLTETNEKLKAEAIVRKKIEQSLEKTKNLYQDIYNNSPYMYVSLDVRSGKVVECNDTLLKKLGYSKEEVVGSPVFKLYHPDNIEEANQVFKGFLAAGSVKNAELAVMSKYGKKIEVILNASAIRNAQGEIIGARGYWEDISDRKKMEMELKESEALFRFITENSSDIATKHNVEGEYTYVSPACLTLLGYQPEELLGHAPYQFFHPEDMGKFIKSRELLREKPETDTVSYRFRKKNGSYIWMETTVRSFFNEEGIEVSEALAVSRDITEWKKAEWQLKENARKLVAANKELESFSYSVSHDLRAPLRAIIGYSKILNDDFAEKLGEDGREITDFIKNNASKMGMLIDDLLAFSRLGRQDKKLHGFSMENLVEEVINELKINHRDRNILYQVQALPDAVADQAMIKQVVSNLLSNAVKFTGNNDKAVISISSFRKDGEVVYKIEDNGVGFNMKYVNKIFGVFQRLHSEAEFEGTGVGMALTQRIIQRHGGKIWAEGELGKGAIFYFTLGSTSGTALKNAKENGQKALINEV